MKKTACFVILPMLVFALSANELVAIPNPAQETTERVNRSWIGISSNWFDPANWYPAGVPTSSDNVEILAGATYYPVIDNTHPTCSNLTIHTDAILTMRRGSLNVMGDFYVEGTYHASNTLAFYQVIVNVWGHLTFREYSTATISTVGPHDINLYGYFSVWNGADVHWNVGNLNLVGNGNWLFQIANASGCYVNHLNIQKTTGAFAYLTQNLTLKGNLTIASGALDTSGYNITIGGNWDNQVGLDAFAEQTGTVTFNGSADQYISHAEMFYTLVLNKSGGDLKLPDLGYPTNYYCEYYDWVSGTFSLGLNAWLSVFHLTAGYIEGNWVVNAGNLSLSCYEGPPDLAGNLEVNNGMVTIFTWSDSCDWPRNGDPFTPASLTMTSGFIEIKCGLNIWQSDVYPGFTENITGGGIRVNGDLSFASNFTPTGGTVEVNSTDGVNITSLGGNLHGFTSGGAGSVTLLTDLLCTGDVWVASFDLNYHQLSVLGDVNVSGVLNVGPLSTLRLTSGHSLNILFGGTLDIHGDLIGDAKLTRYQPGDYYGVTIQANGTIKASWAIFEYLDMSGVTVMPWATVDPEHSFNNCIFRYGVDFGSLLTLDNSDNLLIDSATFIAGEAMFNVRKTVDDGVVNMVNAVGTFSGEDYDLDGYERVIWTSPTAAIDLRIIAAKYETSSAYPGDWIRVKVTMVNASITPCSIPYWIYLYFNRDTPPLLQMVGDTWVRDFTTRTGVPYDFTFEFYLYDQAWAGPWTSWLQIDGEGEVAESNETNNVFGPIETFEFKALPQVSDLTIEPTPAGAVRLDWTYPIPVTYFKVYAASNPQGPYVYDGWALETDYIGHTADSRKFYKVTAERTPPSP